jgi:phospholipase C
LGNGPFQLSRYMAYSDFPGDPVHRFFQMWQQVGNSNKKDLFVWVAETAGIGNHNDGFGATPADTFQGGLAMGCFNMNTGDAPFFKQMADFYAISDNYHQPIMGGRWRRATPRSTMRMVNPRFPQPALSTRVYRPAGGEPQSAIGRRKHQLVHRRWLPRRLIRQLRGPQPVGGKPIVDYLTTLKVKPNCAPNTYYLVNNYNLGYKADGTLANPICDPLTGFTSIMTTSLKKNLQDVNSLYDDIKGGTVPAVAFVRPLEQMAGHPANAVLALYENFVTNLANMVHDQPDLWNKTAILITYDEGGGYYDTRCNRRATCRSTARRSAI